MPFHAERRKYQRCDSIIYKAQMSTDQKRWKEIELADLSAGGLSFTDHAEYIENTRLYFSLFVYNMLSEFNINVEGRVIRIDRSKAKRTYSVVFENINKYQQVQLDELVKSKITLHDIKHEPVSEEQYSTFLFPKPKSKSRGIKLREYK